MRAGRRPDAAIPLQEVTAPPLAGLGAVVLGAVIMQDFTVRDCRRSQGAKDRSGACTRIANLQANAEQTERESSEPSWSRRYDRSGGSGGDGSAQFRNRRVRMSGSRSRSRRLRRWRLPRPWHGRGERAARACSGCPGRFGTPDNGATETTARPARMVSNDPIKDYMQRHACGFAQALDALAAQLGPPHRPRHQTRSTDAGPGRSAGRST
jgi:hypothetical protein